MDMNGDGMAVDEIDQNGTNPGEQPQIPGGEVDVE